MGKAATHFAEKANELGNAVLTNKSNQTTRFARATLRGLTAAARNWPTIHTLISEEYEAQVNSCHNTEAKELKKTMDKMTNMENVLLIIGIIQLLELYCIASVASQHSQWFPT